MLIPFTLSRLYAVREALDCAADKFLDFDRFYFLSDLIDANISAAEGYYLNHDGHDWIVDIPDGSIAIFCLALISFCKTYKTPDDFVNFVNSLYVRCISSLS